MKLKDKKLREKIKLTTFNHGKEAQGFSTSIIDDAVDKALSAYKRKLVRRLKNIMTKERKDDSHEELLWFEGYNRALSKVIKIIKEK